MHIEEHKSLKKYNTFAIDCSARYFASIQSISDLKKALKSKIHSKIFIQIAFFFKLKIKSQSIFS